MTAKKSRTVGEAVEVPEGARVVFPDGSAATVTGGSVFLDRPGVFEVDGTEITVEAAGSDDTTTSTSRKD